MGAAPSTISCSRRSSASSISYGGARSLGELRRLFWADPDRYVVKLSPSARVKSYERA